MEPQVTPLHIMMLMHYNGCCTPYALYDHGHRRSRAVSQYRAELCAWGLIKPIKLDGNIVRDDPDRFSDTTAEQDDVGLYGATDRGKVLITAMCALPLPESITEWRMPT